MLWSILLRLFDSVVKNNRILVVVFATAFGMLRASLIQPQPISPSCTESMRGLPSCDFDKSWCGLYTNQSMDKGGLVWKRGNTIAAEGGGKSIKRDWQPGVKVKRGRFAYLDVGNKEVYEGSKARLNGRILSKDTNAVCIEFHYATTTPTYASNSPTISVINHMKGELEHVIGAVNDNTHGQWKTARFHSCVGKSSIIAFESEKISNDTLVGLDYIKITESNMDCSNFPAYCTDSMHGLPSCNFDKNFCGIYKVKSVDNGGLKWSRRQNISDITQDWQPKKGAGRVGHFVNLDVNELNVRIGAKSRLTGKIINPKIRAVCVEFHYYISSHDGNQSPVVTIINERRDGSEHLMGEISGDTKGKWKKAQFHFCVGTLSMISFESEKISPTSFVGLDYIKVTRSDMGCPTPITVFSTTAQQTTETIATKNKFRSITTIVTTPVYTTLASKTTKVLKITSSFNTNPTPPFAKATTSKMKSSKASPYTNTASTMMSATSSTTRSSSVSASNLSKRRRWKTSTVTPTAPPSTISKITKPNSSTSSSTFTFTPTPNIVMPKMTHTTPSTSIVAMTTFTSSTTPTTLPSAISSKSTKTSTTTSKMLSTSSTPTPHPSNTMLNTTELTTRSLVTPPSTTTSTSCKPSARVSTSVRSTTRPPNTTATITAESTNKSMMSPTRPKPITPTIVLPTRNGKGIDPARITSSLSFIHRVTTARNEKSKSGSHDGASTTIIAGSAVGVTLCLFVIVAIVFALRRRRRKFNNAFNELYVSDDDSYGGDDYCNNAVGTSAISVAVINDKRDTDNVIQLCPVSEDSSDFHC